MKKRILTLTLAVMMIAATLIGCGNDTTKDETNVTPNTEVTTETPTPDTNVETDTTVENTETVETEDWKYTTTWQFPEGMDGFTDKFVSSNDKTWSKNQTHYVDNNGNVMDFVWEGPAELGEKAGYVKTTITLAGGDYELRAWYGGTMTMEDIEPSLELDKETMMSPTATICTPVENGYYNMERVDNTIVVTYEIVDNGTQKVGFAHYLYNADAGEIYCFIYSEKSEIYNSTRAMKVIDSIKFWDYEPTNE